MASNAGTVNVTLGIDPENVQVLIIKPGDTLVLKSPSHHPAEARMRLAQLVKDATGCEKVLVLDGGMDLQVVRQEQAP